MYSALFTFNTMTEVPLSKAPNPQLLPGRRNIKKWLPTAPAVCVFTVCVCVCVFTAVCVCSRCVCVCVFTAVCVHFGWDKCRAQILSMGNHTWPYVTSLSLSTFYPIVFTFYIIIRTHFDFLFHNFNIFNFNLLAMYLIIKCIC